MLKIVVTTWLAPPEGAAQIRGSMAADAATVAADGEARRLDLDQVGAVAAGPAGA